MQAGAFGLCTASKVSFQAWFVGFHDVSSLRTLLSYDSASEMTCVCVQNEALMCCVELHNFQIVLRSHNPSNETLC